MRPVDLIPDFTGVVSDQEGRFQYPATTRFHERIQVTVKASGYRDLTQPMIDGEQKAVTEGSIDLGTFRLFKLPAVVKSTVSVIDAETKQPVAAASVVCVGIDSGKRSAWTSKNGVATLDLLDTSQLVAVKADGYELKLSFLQSVPDKIQVLVDAESKDSKKVAWLEEDWKSWHEQAKVLLGELEIPAPKKSTFYRQDKFFKSQLNTDFDAFKNTVLNPRFKHQQDILLYNASDIFLNSPEESVLLLQKSKLSADQKSMLLCTFALLSENIDRKEELYGEAIVSAGECSGVKKLYAVGQIANLLVMDGQIEAAKELVAETWESEVKLQKQLKTNDAKVRVESRGFVPMIGIVDADAAIKLIRLTGRQVEVPRLITQCLAFASIVGGQDLELICKENKVEFESSGIIDKLSLMDLSHAKYESLVKWIIQHVDAMPDSAGKVAAIMFAARQMPEGAERSRLLEDGCDSNSSLQGFLLLGRSSQGDLGRAAKI